jgi:hypothetical protein
MISPVLLPKSMPKCKRNVSEETLRQANSTVLAKAKMCLFGAIIKKNKYDLSCLITEINAELQIKC